MTDRNELRHLAEVANKRGGWYPAGVMWDVLIEYLQSQTAEEDAAYIAAAPPKVVLGLLDEIERLREEAKHALVIVGNVGRELGQTQHERDQLRAALEAVANHNPAVTHGWAVHVREMARNALKACGESQ